MRAPLERLAYSRDEVAKMLGVSTPMVDGLIKSGELRHLRIGARYLIPKAALDAYIGKTVAGTDDSA